LVTEKQINIIVDKIINNTKPDCMSLRYSNLRAIYISDIYDLLLYKE